LLCGRTLLSGKNCPYLYIPNTYVILLSVIMGHCWIIIAGFPVFYPTWH
jgi:hypothetical protein